MEKIRKNKKVIAVFLIPAVLIYLCFELIPVVMSVYFSFNDWPGLQAVPLKFVGFKNFTFLLKSNDLPILFRNTLGYNLCFILINLVLGVTLAILITEITNLKFRKAAQSSILFPFVVYVYQASYSCYHSKAHAFHESFRVVHAESVSQYQICDNRRGHYYNVCHIENLFEWFGLFWLSHCQWCSDGFYPKRQLNRLGLYFTKVVIIIRKQAY